MPSQITLLNNAEIVFDTPLLDEKYVIEEKETNTDTEKLVFKMAHYFFKDEKQGFETFTYKYVVETFFAEDIPRFYNRNGEYPLMSLVLFLEEGGTAIFAEGVSLDKYKMKDIQKINTGVLCEMKSHKLVKYDNESYTGVIKPCKKKMLLFYLWKKATKLEDIKPFTEDVFSIKKDFNINLSLIENRVQLFENVVESLIYENTNDTFLLENGDTYFSTKINEDCLEFIKEKYGETVLPFFDRDKYPITKENPFYKNKIYQKTFTEDICFWMMNEYDKNEEFVVSSPYKNYQNYMKIDQMPSLFSFVSFFSNHLLDRAQTDYGILEKRMNIQFTDFFLCKYNGKNTFNPMVDTLNQQIDLDKDMVSDDSFLSFNIVLNDHMDYIGNEVLFERMIDPVIIQDNQISTTPEMFSEMHKMQQGDMMVYNGNAKRTNGRVVAGSKYVLVIMTKLHV